MVEVDIPDDLKIPGNFKIVDQDIFTVHLQIIASCISAFPVVSEDNQLVFECLSAIGGLHLWN